MEHIDGVIVSLTTPFKDEKIDYKKLETNIERLNSTGIKGYLALGGNAEAQALSEKERSELLGIIGGMKGDKILLAGLYCESVLRTADIIDRYASLGADYIRLAPPHYFPYLVDDSLLQNYFNSVADSSAVPIILYNAPKLAGGVHISASVAESLAVHPNIRGIKDSSLTGLYKFINIRRSNPDFDILAGSASFFFPALMAGASGGDMTAANYLPEACCELFSLVRKGELNGARELHGRLLAVNSFVSGSWGFCGVKAAMDAMGYEGGSPRSPYRLPGKDDRLRIENLLKAEGFI